MLTAVEDPRDRRPIRVLLIESNPIDVQFLSGIFATERFRDFKLLTATHLTEALRILEFEQVDVALVDLFLRDSYGLRSLKAIHDASPNTAVVALTDHFTGDVAINMLHHSAQDYLIKENIDGPILFHAIHDALRLRKWLMETGQMECVLTDFKGTAPFWSLADDVAWNSTRAIQCWNEFASSMRGGGLNPEDTLRIVPRNYGGSNAN